MSLYVRQFLKLPE